MNFVVQSLSSVQFSRSVVSDSLWPHESQHARPPCPSQTPRVYSNSCPSSRWCHPAISSSVVPFSSCPNSSQHQSLFHWVNSSQEVARVLEFQLQHQSFQWTSSHVQFFVTPRTAACKASLSFTISLGLFKAMSFGSMMPSNYLILYHLLLFLPSIFPKYWSFSFSMNVWWQVTRTSECVGMEWWQYILNIFLSIKICCHFYYDWKIIF